LTGTKLEGLPELGRGGMGIVYRAPDGVLDRDVAVKVLKPELHPGGQSRFINEAQIHAGLEHPGIVPIHSLGYLEDDGRLYFTMKVVEGGVTLANLLSERERFAIEASLWDIAAKRLIPPNGRVRFDPSGTPFLVEALASGTVIVRDVAWMEGNVAYRLHMVRLPEGAEGFVRLPQRWVVERTFAWIGRSRRLHKDCEKLTETSAAMVKISMIHLMLRRLASDTPTQEFFYTEKLAA
jgi:hypothetical protein